MTFSFTHDGIGNIVIRKSAEGVDVEGVFETTQINPYSEFHKMEAAGIEVFLDGNPNAMHHKVFIIDEKVVVTGSFNPSNNGDYHNDENIVIIEDEGIAKEFVEEYYKIKEKSTHQTS